MVCSGWDGNQKRNAHCEMGTDREPLWGTGGGGAWQPASVVGGQGHWNWVF
jgi:hypothetical protein